MAALAPTAPVEGPPSRRAQGPSALSVGVVVWLASELMFFSGLFAGWFTLRSNTSPWPPVGVELSTGRTALATVALVVSSVTMHRALGAAKRGDRRLAQRWLALTGALGAAFIANQALEYAGSTFRISSHAYGSMFFLLTGFHGLHVIGGLALMAAVAWMVSGRGARAPIAPTLEVCAYYWHFVDAVWVAMFATIYILK
ncbi:MAG: cytochrome c oxidase subunit 3 [Acidimicrobiales bacterium]